RALTLRARRAAPTWRRAGAAERRSSSPSTSPPRPKSGVASCATPASARNDDGAAAPRITSGLAALVASPAHDPEFLQLPAPRWTPPLQHDGDPVADVAIIGAGMTG